MTLTKILRPDEKIEKNFNNCGAVVFDGDGDGISAAAIWLMANPGRYLGITNPNKDRRNIVSDIFGFSNGYISSSNKFGIFDLDAESNCEALEKLANTGASIDFFDHHTRDVKLVPNGVNNYSQKDRYNNSTASIVYNAISQDDIFKNSIIRERALECVVIGLSNDSKKIEQIKSTDIEEDNLSELVAYGRVLNFAASDKNFDRIEILNGLTNKKPLSFLQNSDEVKRLAGERNEMISDVRNKIVLREEKDYNLHIFPHQDLKARERSEGIYKEMMNEFMRGQPLKYSIGYLITSDGRTIIVCRHYGGQAFSLMKRFENSFDREAKGRETAAGIGLPYELDVNNFINIIKSGFE